MSARFASLTERGNEFNIAPNGNQTHNRAYSHTLVLQRHDSSISLFLLNTKKEIWFHKILQNFYI